MAVCCPCYCCSAMFLGIWTLQLFAALFVLPGINQYVTEVDCNGNSDGFGGYASKDALHHLTGCDVTEIRDSFNRTYLAVGSYFVDAQKPPDGDVLIPGRPFSFLGNLSSGTLDYWNYGSFGSYICLASKNSVPSAVMIGNVRENEYKGGALCIGTSALSLVGSAYKLFFADSPSFKPRVLGVAALTWLSSVLTMLLAGTLGLVGWLAGVAVVLGCLFVDNLDDKLLELKDALLSSQARFSSSSLEEPLLPTQATPSPALVEAAAPEATGAIQPNQFERNTFAPSPALVEAAAPEATGAIQPKQLERNTFAPSPALIEADAPEATATIQPDQVERKASLTTFILLGMVAGLGGGVVLLLGLSMSGFQ